MPLADALQLSQGGSPKHEKAAMRWHEVPRRELAAALQHFAGVTVSLAKPALDTSDGY